MSISSDDTMERQRDAVASAVPEADDSTPLARELAEEARKRIALEGVNFPRPAHTRIMTVSNQKGGVGKTTSAVNMAAALAGGGLDVLVIDNDPQGNASTALGVEHRAGTSSLYDVLLGEQTLADVVVPSAEIPGLQVVPSTIDLSGAEIELVGEEGRESRLRAALETYLKDRERAGERRLDYVLIDCPPSLGLLTINALTAAREVFIPVQCEYYALEGLSQLVRSIEMVREHLNADLRITTIMLTMSDRRTNLSREVADEVRSHFPEQTLEVMIPRNVRISEAPSFGQTVLTYDPSSAGSLAYREAARELTSSAQSSTGEVA